MELLTSPLYDGSRGWVRKKRDKGIEWERLYFADKGSEEKLAEFIEARIDEDDWPSDMNTVLWRALVMAMKEAEEKSQKIGSGGATLKSSDENNKVTVPEDERSAWQLYRRHLINEKGFKKTDVDNIEKSCITVLKNMSDDTSKVGAVKGLVLGNVQSGKTGNMAGLMAMAADWGWNLVIVLSGTIENLRKQTQKRLYSDLYHAGNLTWVSYEHLSNSSPLGQRASDLHFEKDSNQRYMTVCLKNKTRLENLIDWLQKDKKQMEHMKILVIDDEADQGGVNTANIYSESDRKTINKLLINLVSGKNKAGDEVDGKYGAMNYVMYTATPYANCLNESGPGTLYPDRFIHCLKSSNEYIGPEQIFGIKDANVEPLNIIRTVSQDEKKVIAELHKGERFDIPKSMQKAIFWFICAVAAMRVRGYKKPVSMLVHTSQNQAHHSLVADAIKVWFNKAKCNIVESCKAVYEEETAAFDKASFKKSYYEYGRPDDSIWDYPKFEEIKPHIEEISKSIESIMMDNDDGFLTYSRQLHMCIDNCSFNGVGEYGEHMRLAYPDMDMDFAPAFIVIGGNTLSRGLTLEGLVSTFFLRTVGQGDTLMQMGRWFGYRPHYELFPRVWMTDKTKEQFEFLADMDSDLRHQLEVMNDRSPMEFNLALKSSPSIIAITAKNKMQQSAVCDIDFTGSDIQLTTYSKDKTDLEHNIKVADDFLAKLGVGTESEITKAVVWNDIDFNVIAEELLNKYKVPVTSRAFSDKELLYNWVSENTAKNNLGKWSVIVAGTNAAKNDEADNWILPDGNVVGKISRTIRTETDETVNIGVLSTKKDYIADLVKENIPTVYADIIKSTRQLNKCYEEIRSESGRGDVPLLLVYRIKKDSMPVANSSRKGLNSPADLIGFAMVIPGVRGKRCLRIAIKHYQSDDVFDESEIDVNEN